MSTYYTLLTNVGLAKMINAQALGTIVQWSAMAVGDGNGNPTNPTQAQTALLREKYRAPLNQLSIDPVNPNYLIAEMIIPATEGGWTVHEVGLFDADGDMVAVANFPMTYKPLLADGSTRDLVIRIIIEVSNAATVQLKIDPAVVLASRQWVMTNYVEKVTLNGGTVNQVLRKKSNANLDVEWADPMAAVQVIVVSREETQTLAAAQTVVDLAVITTDGCAVYIEGVRLLASQFTRTSPTRVTLASAYPAGTKITVVQNEETGDYPQATEVQSGVAEIATTGEATTGTDDNRIITPLKLKQAIDARKGRLIGVQVFTANGTYTPSAGMASAVIESQAGGGAGAGITTPSAGNISLGAPGGPGAYAIGRFLAAAIGASQAVTVGAGGTPAAAAAGGAGGTSSVGTLISTPGGSGGGLLNNQVSPINNGNGVATAAPTGGNIYGTRGITNGISQSTSTNFGIGGFGGASKFGNGGSGGVLNGNGGNALNYGAGGGGTCGASGATALSGGAGFGGIVIIWEYA